MSSTSPLAQAIRFRVLADQLSDSEFMQFTTRIVSRFGRNILLTPISSKITGTKSDRFEEQTVNELIGAIKEIINDRKDDEATSIASKAALDALPGPLIGEISSYLKQNELGSFCRGSRSIFVGCSEYVSVCFGDLHIGAS